MIYQSTQIRDNYRPMQQSTIVIPPPTYHSPIQTQQITHSHPVYSPEQIPMAYQSSNVPYQSSNVPYQSSNVAYQSSNMSFGPKSYVVRPVLFQNDPNFQQASSHWPIQQIPPNGIPSANIPNQPPF